MTKMGGFDTKGVEREHEEVAQVREVILTRPEKVEIIKSVVLGTKLTEVEVLTVETPTEQQSPKANLEFSPVNCQSNEKQVCRSNSSEARQISFVPPTAPEEAFMGEDQEKQGSRAAVDQNLVVKGH